MLVFIVVEVGPAEPGVAFEVFPRAFPAGDQRVGDGLAQRVQRQRGTQRKARSRNGVFKVSLVGYTNAGKSTLFNALTKARAYAANQLFATLDTTTRSLYLEQAGASVSLSDTVGFIRDLPHKLVEAFRATLQEAADADLLLHVVDASSPVLEEQMAEVEKVLAEIGAADVPQILVYNKQDLLADDQRPREIVDAVLRTAGGSEPTPRVFVSAIAGGGLTELRQLIAAAMHTQPLIPDERDPRFDADPSHPSDSGEPSSSDPSQA